MNTHNCSRCHQPGHYAKKCKEPMPAPDPMLFPAVTSEAPQDGHLLSCPLSCPTCAGNRSERDRFAYDLTEAKTAARKVLDTLREAGLIE